MGLYSTVISTWDGLGPEMKGEFQTKDLQSVLDTYWLSPNGELFYVNDGPTWDLVPATEGEGLFPCFRRVSTGQRGVVKPYRYSGVMTLTGYPSVEAVVYMKCGVVNTVLCTGPIFSCRGTVQDELC